ncbi:unnamed protein product [Colias eurytheme]|nr:unnamed protein product [Colias eurytheme]
MKSVDSRGSLEQVIGGKMNNLLGVFVFISIFLHVNGDLFDRYSGKKFDEPHAKELRIKKYADKCSIDIPPCAAHEVSRVSGTCNNYKRPASGAARRPYLRLLPPEYANQHEIRKSKDGKPLPSARTVRTSLKPTTSYLQDKNLFNVAAFHFMELIRKDVSALNGPLDYLKKRQNCCTVAGEQDPRCLPIHVQNDPYLKGIDCLNFSRAETFQDLGCTQDAVPAQINYQTPLLDLSIIYGVDEQSMKELRSFKNGTLKLEMRGNRYLPANNGTDCFLYNDETCYTIGLPKETTLDLRTTTFVIFFMREHNRLAKVLQELNPCWKDDRLFKVARQINIATASNIFLYELLPRILGYQNMLTYDLISTFAEHVSAYDEQKEPGVFAEFDIAMRFFRTFLGGKIEKYNENYENVGEIELDESYSLLKLLEVDTKFDEISRGTFFQSAGETYDKKISNVSANQQVHDQVSLDIQRGRDLGLQGYNAYRNFCGMKAAKDFYDLTDVIDGEKVEILKKLYSNVDDIDLLVGIMSENNIEGTLVGPTLFCIMVKQIQLFRFSDRFWFERGDNYHSFTFSQLREIRRTNMARFACDNVEAIKFIQPHALLATTHWNTPLPCSHITGPNLEAWRDASCKENGQIDTKFLKYNYPDRNEFPEYSSFLNDILSTVHL